MSLFKPPQINLPSVPNQPPPPPAFGQQQSPGSKPKAKPTTPTFLGTGDQPTKAQLGTKTLLGQ